MAKPRKVENAAATEVVVEDVVAGNTTDASNGENGYILDMLRKMQERMDKMEVENQYLSKRNEELEGKLKAKEEIVVEPKVAYESTVAFTPTRTSLTDMVTICCNFYGTMDLELPDLNLTMSTFGETRDVTYQQFQQLVGKYRKFFDREWVLVDAKHIDLIEKFKVHGYDPASKKYLHAKDLEGVGKLNAEELREFYENLNSNSKNAFLSLWLNKCYERNPDFYDFGKMTTLNVASKSRTFDGLIQEYSRYVQDGASSDASSMDDRPIRI